MVKKAAAVGIPRQIDIGTQMSLLEADISGLQLIPGSIKGAMREVNGDGKTAPSRDLWQCDPFKLEVIEDLNPRLMTPGYLAHIQSIKESMISEGYYQDKPLAGYVISRDGENIVKIYEGGTRLLAARLAINEGAEFDRVPVSVKQDGVNLEDILVAMARGNSGRPLAPYELGIICKRLAKFGWSRKDISTRIGVTATYVDDVLLLMASPIEIREWVATEKITATLAIDMVKQFKDGAIEKIRQALEAAQEAGKSKVTKRYVPGAMFNKAIQRSAAPMYGMLSDLPKDPGFKHLSPQFQQQLVGLLNDLKAKADASASADADAAAAVEQEAA